jgi:hypothetical protein
MYDIGLSWLDFVIILSGFAVCGTLVGLTIWLLDRAVAPKRRETMLRDCAPETSSARSIGAGSPCKDRAFVPKLRHYGPDLSGIFSAKYDPSTRKVLIEGKVQQGRNEYSLDNVVDPFLGLYPRSQAIVNEEVLQILIKVLNETLPPDQRAKYVG